MTLLARSRDVRTLITPCSLLFRNEGLGLFERSPRLTAGKRHTAAHRDTSVLQTSHSPAIATQLTSQPDISEQTHAKSQIILKHCSTKAGIWAPDRFLEFQAGGDSGLSTVPEEVPYQFLRRMRSYVQFLSTPTVDTPGTTLVLHFDHKRYLIGNIAEGTQRAATQQGTRLIKVSDIFLTGRVEWGNTGGLIGMILTLADSTSQAVTSLAANSREKAERLKIVGPLNRRSNEAKHAQDAAEKALGSLETNKASLTIHGGKNLAHMLATARRFVFRKGMPLQLNEFPEGLGSQCPRKVDKLERPHKQDLGEEARAGLTRPSDDSLKPSDHSEASSPPKSDQDASMLMPTWQDENIMVWAISVAPRSGPHFPQQEGQKTPGKRSYDESNEREQPSVNIAHSNADANLEEQDRNDAIRKAVVSEMFDSKWRMDALEEMPLSEVRMPATIFVRNKWTGSIERYMGPIISSGQNTEDKAETAAPQVKSDPMVLVRKPWPGALIGELPTTFPSTEALSYIFRNHYQRGRFQPAKAAALGVERGRKWAMLANGENAVATDGTTVTPDMVLGEGKVGAGIAVVDLPSVDYIAAFVERSEWTSEKIMDGVEAMVWILGPGVCEDARLHRFMKERQHMEHIVSSPDTCPNYLAFSSAATAAVRLNQVDPARFPIPMDDRSTCDASPKAKPALFRPAQRGTTIQLEPVSKVDEPQGGTDFNVDAIAKTTSPDVLELARQAKQWIATEGFQKDLRVLQQDLPGKDAEIITLGTGSAQPSKYRNVSATLLRVPGYGSYLLDCGENTMGQLRRVYDSGELAEVLRDLRMIWISHLHADHHLGTASVIKAWYKENWTKQEPHGRAMNEPPVASDLVKVLEDGPRLFVVSDQGMIQWLKEYAAVEDYGFQKLVALSISSNLREDEGKTRLSWGDAPVGFDTGNEELDAAMRAGTGLIDIQAANVNHCKGAKAVSLTFSDGFKFSYSGDCRPSKAFAKIGQGSTVLLHEATFDDELQGDALAKKHSTTSEALGVGLAMGARRVLLTHFSQRYQKIPVMDNVDGMELTLEDEEEESAEALAARIENRIEESVSGTRRPRSLKLGGDERAGQAPVTIKRSAAMDVKVGVAFDYMRVKVGEISHLEHFTPALLKLYEQAEVDEEVQPKGAGKNGKAAKKGKESREQARAAR